MTDPKQPSTSTPSGSTEAGTEKTSIRVSDPVIGTEVSGYVVKGQLGQGGMGIVYEGEQPTIGKRVAIKVLRHEVADNPDVVRRLVSEARAVNQVGHRGIIDVFGVGQLPDGRQCIVMEFLDGESLETLLTMYRKENRLMPTLDALVIVDEILSALAAAHRAGVVHRDVKPSNIFLCKQQDGTQYVKLLDFGIAKLGVLGKATPTTRGMMMGTPLYMAPEQARMASGSPSMDLYALGVVFFEILTNQLPFVRDTIVSLLLAHQTDPAPRPSSLVASVPAELDALVLKLLEKDVAQRYQTAEEVRADVVRLRKQLASPTAVVVVGVNKPEPAPPAPTDAHDDLAALKPSTARRWFGPAVVGLALVAAVGFWLSRNEGAAPAISAPAISAVRPAPEPVREPVALAPPVVAPPAIVAEPKRTTLPKPDGAPKPTARPAKSFEARLDAISARLKKIAEQGEDVSLTQRLVEKARALLRAELTQEKREQLELVLTRLEEDSSK